MEGLSFMEGMMPQQNRWGFGRVHCLRVSLPAAAHVPFREAGRYIILCLIEGMRCAVLCGYTAVAAKSCTSLSTLVGFKAIG